MFNVYIRIATINDINNVLKTFDAWHKTKEQFVEYLAKQDRGESVLIIALTEDKNVAGYANLFWQSRIEEHLKENIPEIVDLNVITEYQRKGIATKMICYLENLVKGKGILTIGIAVSPTADYLPANRLYHKLGYEDEKKTTIIDGEDVLIMRKCL